MSTQQTGTQKTNELRHLAIIPDGNGRWAEARGMSRSEGHEEGARNVERILSGLQDIAGLDAVSFFGFAEANWSRKQEEVERIFDVIEAFVVANTSDFVDAEFQVRFIGRRDRLRTSLRTVMERIEARTAHSNGKLVVFAIDYAGQGEYDRAVHTYLKRVLTFRTNPFKGWRRFMDTEGLPPVDLLIRTGEEKRISDFLPALLAHTEIIFREAVLWPDYTLSMLADDIESYEGVTRNFGGDRPATARRPQLTVVTNNS